MVMISCLFHVIPYMLLFTLSLVTDLLSVAERNEGLRNRSFP